MDFLLESAKLAISQIPTILFTVAAIILFYIKYPEGFDRLIAKLTGLFSSVSMWAERRTIKHDLQAEINAFQKTVDSEAVGILPYGIDIRWVHNETRDAFFEGGTIVVRMRFHTNRDKNLVIAALTYVSKALLPRSREYIGHHLLRALDLTTVRKLLRRSKQPTAVTYFVAEIVEPEMRERPEIRESCITLEKLDDQGFFTRILLRELLDLGDRLYLRTPDRYVFEDVRGLVHFIETIADRAPHEDVPLGYIGRNTKVGIILIARPATYVMHGLEPYIRRVNTYVEDGCQSLYLCAMGTNISVARDLATELEQQGRFIVFSAKEYIATPPNRRPIKAICIPVRPRSEVLESD